MTIGNLIALYNGEYSINGLSKSGYYNFTMCGEGTDIDPALAAIKVDSFTARGGKIIINFKNYRD